MSGDSSSSAGSGSGGGAAIQFDYSTINNSKNDRNTNHNKPPMFNGDPEMFSWWKTKMYSQIIGMDEELWDILEEGVGNLRLDEEGVALDRKAQTAEQKKLYKKHHLIRGTLVAALPHKEYLRMSDKSTAKAIFTSLCSNYEGNKKVKEAKATMLVHQYELFRMKEDESIETMYSRFQTLVSGLQILKKSYVASDHVNKILRSLPAKWRLKVTAIAEAKDLNTLSAKDLIRSYKLLKSRGKSTKALKALEFEVESTSEDSDEDPEIVQKMAMLSNRLQYLAKKNKRFLSRSNGYKGSRKEEKGCFNCKKTGHFIAECPDLQKDKSKKPIYKSNKLKKQIKKSLMATWEDLDNESESDKEDAADEAKVAMALVATKKIKMNHLMLNPLQILKLKLRYILNSPDVN